MKTGSLQPPSPLRYGGPREETAAVAPGRRYGAPRRRKRTEMERQTSVPSVSSCSKLPVRSSIASLAFALAWLAAALQGFGAEPVNSLTPPAATHYVLVTNVVVVTVTNYVITTNAVVSTNAFSAGRGAPTSALPNLNWVPPLDSFDWIQLNTGEWLKGRVKAMQDRQIEFFSEKLSDMTFDWKDIRQVRSPRTIDVLFVDGQKVSGSVMVTPEQVTVTPEPVTEGGAPPHVMPRDQLQSLTPGGARERDYWSLDLSLGLSLQAGNARSVQYNAQVGLQRRTPATRLSLDYIGNVSSINGAESANNNRLNTEFDLWLSRRFYLVLPAAEYYKDPFQNLAGRLTVGGGVGYDLIDRSRLEWNVTTGPAYQYAWFDSAEAGEPTEKGTAALTFSTRLKWDITSRIKWILEYRGQFTSKEVGETTHHTVGTLSIDLNKRLTLDVSGIWDRISSPKAGANGIEPKPDDFRLVVGLGMHF
jgi:putative salt-induced outer membrane protein YdiY